MLLPCDIDLVVSLIGSNGLVETCLLPVSEPLPTAAKDCSDPVQRVALAAPMTQRLLLDASPDIINGLRPEFDVVESINDCRGIVERVIDGVLISRERIERSDPNAGGEFLTSVFEPVLVHSD